MRIIGPDDVEADRANGGNYRGTVAVGKVYPMMRELVDRVGWEETIERTGLSRTSIWRILHCRYPTVKKDTVGVVILTLYQVRREMRCQRKQWVLGKKAKDRINRIGRMEDRYLRAI